MQRLLRWAEATGVVFESVPRHRGWGTLGLPDLRGFAPQRRVVRRFAGERAEYPRRRSVAGGRVGLDDLTVAELWLLHDLAHVLWYDVATLTFGAARWREEAFFLEQHLASEAFAVLLLDYHLLARTGHRGLAVELDAGGWEATRRRVRALPSLDSLAMARALVGHYLGAEVPLFRAPIGEPPLAARGRDALRLARWRDHEVSYADKQRWYVALWSDALAGRRHVPRQIVVEDDAIAEAIWLTVRWFTEDPEPAFAAQLERAARRLRKSSNSTLDRSEEAAADRARGAGRPGALRSRARRASRDSLPDFRFNDTVAFARRDLVRFLAAAEAPSAEGLFLLWQLLALQPPRCLTASERRAVAALATSVQQPTPDPAAWRVVRELARRSLAAVEWRARREQRDAFFLP